MKGAMTVSEDRYPLLLVCADNQEDQVDVRTRSLAKGAAHVLGRWPQYLTLVTYMSMLGLLTILVCFVLSVVLLSLTLSEYHGPNGFEKCGDVEGATELSHLKSIGHLSDATGNATFIVDVPSSSEDDELIACAVESYLTRTRLPVYFVHGRTRSNPRNLTRFENLEKKYGNLRLILVEGDSFLSRTAFGKWQARNSQVSRLLMKVLISWNFGGTVLDSGAVTVAHFGDFLGPGRKGLVIGTWSDRVALISSTRVCHSFIFSLIRQMEREGPDTELSQTGLLRKAYERFCSSEDDCSDVRKVSEPFFCESELITERCIFTTTAAFASHDSAAARARICPLAALP